MSVHRRIEKFLRRTKMTATEFGRLALNDPRLVHDLRNGREMRPLTVARVEAFLCARESGQ